jgi:putative sterol carrier protein
VRFDKEYFARTIQVAKEKFWGGTPPADTKRDFLNFSERLAQYYFENYLPSKFTEHFLKKATAGGITVAFLLKGRHNLGWVLKTASDGNVQVEAFNPNVKPTICFRFSGTTMTKLIQSKLPLHRALLMREVEVEGPLLDALRVTNVFEQFLKENPMSSIDFAEVDKR